MPNKIEVVKSQDDGMLAPEPGLRRQVLSYSQSVMLVRHRMVKGWVGVKHSHPHEQMVYIVSGRIVFEHPGGRFEVGPGDSFIVPGDVTHQGVGAGGLRGTGHLHALPRGLCAEGLNLQPVFRCARRGTLDNGSAAR